MKDVAELPYDVLLVVSFGGPEGMDDVMPFLDNVLRGRNVPEERKLEVAEHYKAFGGVSPINAQNRALIEALQNEFRRAGIDLPIYFGNRNWKPFLPDTLQQIKDSGHKRVLAFVTSAYSSYSGCRQYREDVHRACEQIGAQALPIDKLRVFYNHPAWIQVNAELVQAALDRLPTEVRNAAPILFTAHSIPMAMAKGCRYEEQLTETARLVAEALGHSEWKLVYQSRSGPPSQPWLEPDVCDALQQLHENGKKHVVVAPIGFISDHLEVIFDLDTEAHEVCETLGLQMERAATAGTHPTFVAMIRELVQERLNVVGTERRSMGRFGPSHDVCPPGCCQSGHSQPAQRPV